MANRVEFGLSNVHIATVSISDGGVVTFGEFHALKGAVNLQLDEVGELTPFYADNIVYYRGRSNQGYSGSMEFALFDEWFQTNILGLTKDTNNVLVENADDTPTPFAMAYQVDGDDENSYGVLYYCEASRPSITHATKNETVEVQTQTCDITCSPIPDTKDVVAHTTETTPDATVEAWFTTVYRPQ